MARSIYVPQAGGFVNFKDTATDAEIVSYLKAKYAPTPAPVQQAPAEETPTGPDESTLLGRAAYGFATGFTDIPGGIAGLFVPAEKLDETSAGQFSEEARKYLQDTFGIDPTKDPTAAQQAMQALGSVGSFLVPGAGAAKIASLAGRGAKAAGALTAAEELIAAERAARAAKIAGSATAAAQGAALGSAQRTEKIQSQIESGMEVSPDEQLASQRLDAFVGLSEGLPLGRFFGPLNQVLSKVPVSKAPIVEKIIKSRLANITKAGLAEGAQEAASGIANDLVEYGVYNPDVQIGQDILSNAGTGAFAGSFVESIIQMAAGRRLRPYRQLQSDLAAERQQNVIEARQGEVANAAERLRQLSVEGPVEVSQEEIDNEPVAIIKTKAGNIVGRLPDIESANRAVDLYQQKTGAKVRVVEPVKPPDIFPVKIAGQSFGSMDDVVNTQRALRDRLTATTEFLADAPSVERNAKLRNVAPEFYRKQVEKDVKDIAIDLEKFDEFVRVAAPEPIAPEPAADIEKVDVLRGPASRGEPLPPRVAEAVTPEAAPVEVSPTVSAEVTPSEPTAVEATNIAPAEPAEAVSAVEAQTPIGAVETAPEAAPVAPIGGIAAIAEPEAPAVSPELSLEEPLQSKKMPVPVQVEPEGKPSVGVLPEATRKPITPAEAKAIVSEPREYTPEQKAYDEKLYEELNKRLGSIATPGVKLELKDMIDTLPGYLVRGNVRSNGEPNGVATVVEISKSIYDPNLTIDQHVNKLLDVLNHEIIHIVRRQLRPVEWRALSKAVEITRVPGKKYTYLDKAQAVYTPNGMPISKDYENFDAVVEEAVAEMYKDWVRNGLAPPQTRGAFNRITEFFRRIFRALKSSSYEKAFKAIESGEVRGREIQPQAQTAGIKFSAAPLPGNPMSVNINDREQKAFGLYPYLRTAAPRYYDHNRMILGATNPGNAQAQIANLDTLLARHPNTLASNDAFADYLADAQGKMATPATGVPIIPYKAIEFANNPALIARQIGRLTPGQLAMADSGLSEALRLRQAYMNGSATPVHTAKLILWGILSRGVSPFVQESMFLDVVAPKGLSNRTGQMAGGIDPFILDAVEGNFDLDAYMDYVRTLKIDGLPGAGTTHNLGAFGKTTLTKLQQRVPDGRTLLQYLHDLISDYSLSGKEVRRRFHEVNPGIGINNKVLSFALLVSGRDDVLVLDRVQMRNQFNDGRFNDYNLYDGEKIYEPVLDENGNPVLDRKGNPKMEGVVDAGTGIAHIGDGVFGLMYYEALERDLANSVRQAYQMVGRGNQFSMGRYHWESWVASSAQEVDHGSVSGLIKDALGENDPYSGIYTGEGKYDTFNSGIRYGYTRQGEAYVGLPDGLGRYYYFTPEYAKKVIAGYDKRSTGIISDANFKVSESTEGPWYDRPEVNKQNLRRYLDRHKDAFYEQRRLGAQQAVRSSGQGDTSGTGPGPVHAIRRRGGVRQVSVGDQRAAAQSIADKYISKTGEGVRFSAAPLPAYVETKNDTLFAKHDNVPFHKMIFDYLFAPSAVGKTLRTSYGDIDIGKWTQVGLAGRAALVDKNAAVTYLEKLLNQKMTGNFERMIADDSATAALAMRSRSSHLTAAMIRMGKLEIDYSRPGDILSATMKVTEDADSLLNVIKVLMEPGPTDSRTNEAKDKREVFKSYAVAMRAKNKKAAGLSVPGEVDDAYINATIPFTEQNYPEVVEAYKMYQRFNKKLLESAVKAGLIKRTELDNLTRQMDYYGFYHEVYDTAMVPGMATKTASQFKLRPYRGSTYGNLVNDPVFVMIQNAQFWVDSIAKNLATTKAFNVAKLMGEARLLGTGEDPKEQDGEQQQVMFFKKDGIQQRFAVKDPLLVTALGSDDRIDMGNFMKMLGLPTQLIRESVTRDPGFMVANLLRDTLSSWITSGEDITPFIGTMRGFKSALKKESSFQALMGRGVVGSYDLAMLAPADLANKISKIATPKNVHVVPNLEAGVGAVTALWDRLGALSEASDAATRIAVYESALAQGLSEAEASFRAIEIMDFSRRGGSAVMGVLTKLIPFLNARVQGLDVLYQAGRAGIRVATGRSLGERDANLGKKFLIRGGMLAALSMVLEMWNTDDEDYQQLDEYIKTGNLLVPLKWLGMDGEFLAIPKPFEAGLLFSTFPQQFYKTMVGEASTRENLNLFTTQFGATFGVNFVPQAVLPLAEAVWNIDFYTGLPLISEGKARLAPELQYNSGTSTISMMLGKIPVKYNLTTGKFEGISPIIIENLITGYTGPIGSMIVQSAGVLMDGIDVGPERLPTDLTKLPVVKRVFIDAEKKNPKVVTQAYELFQIVDEANRSFSRLKQMGDVEAIKDYVEENRDVLAYRKYVFKMVDGLNKLNARERQIERDTEMTADEKREAMLKLRELRINIASKVEEINKKLGR